MVNKNIIYLIVFICLLCNVIALNVNVFDAVNCDDFLYVKSSNNNFTLDNCKFINSTWLCSCNNSITGNFSQNTDLSIYFNIGGSSDLNKRVFQKSIIINKAEDETNMSTPIEENLPSIFPMETIILFIGAFIGVVCIIIIIIIFGFSIHSFTRKKETDTQNEEIDKLLEDIKKLK